MKAVVMAAGKGTRMEPLTCTRPKPMLPVANRPFLTHVLDEFLGIVSEAIIVIHPEDTKTPTLGAAYKAIALSYIVQEKQLGTGHALLCARDVITDRFLLVNGDNLFSHDDITTICSLETGLLASYKTDLSAYGALISKGKYLQEIREKSVSGPGYSNAGLYILTPDIFSFTPSLSPRGEYELTDMLNAYGKKKPLTIVSAKEQHYSITYPWDLLEVNQYLLNKIKESAIEANVKGPVAIEGVVIIGKGTEIDAFATVKGPCVIGINCKLGPQTYIRPYTSVGDECIINCEVKNSILYNNAKSTHSSSHLLDSIIGENTNIGANTITANLRHDGQNVLSEVKGKLIDTGLKKFGAIIGDDVHTGIGTGIRPGRKLWHGTTTLEHEVVTKDKH